MKKRVFIISLVSVLFLINLVFAEIRINETGPRPIILGLDWNGNEIINGRDFDIEVSVFNLEDKKYDVKVYIYRDNNENKIISETYYRINWFYSVVYVAGFFIGPGNKTKEISLRISEPYRNFNGSAKIAAKIKEAHSSNIKAEKQSNINILKQGTEIQRPSIAEDQTPTPITGEVIKIKSQRDIIETPSQSNNFIFYFISAFIILIIIFLVLLIIKILR